MNRLPGRLGDNGDVQVLGQRLTVLNPNGGQPGAAVDALLRPEAFAVVRDAAGAGEVTERTFLGSAVRLEVTLDGGQRVLVESSSHGRRRRVGERVGLRILTDSVVLADDAAAAKRFRRRGVAHRWVAAPHGGHPSCRSGGSHRRRQQHLVDQMWTMPFDAGTFAVTTFALLT